MDLPNAPQIMWATTRRDFEYFNHLKYVVDLGRQLQVTLEQHEVANHEANIVVEARNLEFVQLTTEIMNLRARIQEMGNGASSSANTNTVEADTKRLNELEHRLEDLITQRNEAQANADTSLADLQASQTALANLNIAWTNAEIDRVSPLLQDRIAPYATPHWVTILNPADMSSLVLKRHIGGTRLLFAIGTSVKASTFHHLRMIAENQLGIQNLSTEVLYAIHNGEVGPAGQVVANQVGFVPPAQRI